jgi:hypothetical protein
MYNTPLHGSLYLQLCRIFGGLIIPTYAGLFRLAGQHYGTPVGQCCTRQTHSEKQNKSEKIYTKKLSPHLGHAV